MSNNICIDSNTQKIDSVCVFQANRAEVKRTVDVDLKAGQNEVCLENLPNVIDSDSVRVEGVGNAVIFDVIYHPPVTYAAIPTQSQHEEIASLEKDIATLKTEKETVEAQLGLLGDYGDKLNAEKVDLKELSNYLKTYKERRMKLQAYLQELVPKIESLEKRAEDKRIVVREAAADKKRTVKVTVVVLADADGPAELTVWYVLTGAYWTPIYDVRATISKDPKSPSLIELEYRGSINNNSGEDWKDVALTLSTASPQLGTDIPTLGPYRVYPQPKQQLKTRGGGFLGTLKEKSSGSRRRSQYTDEDYSSLGGEPEYKMEHAHASATEGAISSTFSIAGFTTIPSDEQMHRVSITSIDLQAQLEWITLPRMQASAFLRCKVKNTSTYALLAGTSNVFLDGSFVCKSSLPTVSPQESFSTSLGVDPGLKVTYHSLQKKKKTQGGLLSTKTDTTSYTQRISIKNNRSTAASPVYVKDHIPTSEESELKVNLTEPGNLGVAKERNIITTATGITCKWAFHDRDDGDTSKGVEEPGTLEWVCNIDPGKTSDMTMSWEITSPTSLVWQRL